MKSMACDEWQLVNEVMTIDEFFDTMREITLSYPDIITAGGAFGYYYFGHAIADYSFQRQCAYVWIYEVAADNTVLRHKHATIKTDELNNLLHHAILSLSKVAEITTTNELLKEIKNL